MDRLASEGERPLRGSVAPGPLEAGLAARSAARRANMVSHRSRSFREAEQWDLAYWQSQGPEARLSALVAIRDDVRKVEAAREKR